MGINGYGLCHWNAVRGNCHTQSGAGCLDLSMCLYGSCIGLCLCFDMEGKGLIPKKPVTSTLRAMKVNEEEVFSILQRITIMNTLASRLDAERAAGMSWTYRTDRESGIVTVKRIS